MNRMLQPLHSGAGIFRSSLDRVIAQARQALGGRQAEDGHWCFEFEADCTIPAEYILMQHYMDERDEALEARIAVYLRGKQADHGGWPLYKIQK